MCRADWQVGRHPGNWDTENKCYRRHAKAHSICRRDKGGRRGGWGRGNRSFSLHSNAPQSLRAEVGVLSHRLPFTVLVQGGLICLERIGQRQETHTHCLAVEIMLTGSGAMGLKGEKGGEVRKLKRGRKQEDGSRRTEGALIKLPVFSDQ